MTLATISRLPHDHRFYAGGTGKTVSMSTVMALTRKLTDDARPLTGEERELFDILGVDDSPSNRVTLRRAAPDTRL